MFNASSLGLTQPRSGCCHSHLLGFIRGELFSLRFTPNLCFPFQKDLLAC